MINKKSNNKLSKTVLCKECNTKLSLPLSANFCSKCCALLPSTRKFITEYFRRTTVNNKLNEAKRLFLKNEYIAAARVATIVLEKEIRKLIKDDNLFGVELMTKAFSFEYDERKNRIIREPLIKFNSLKTKSDRNEQEGMKFFCMGIMEGVRNVIIHSAWFILPFRSLILISDIEYILQEITRGSSLIRDHK